MIERIQNIQILIHKHTFVQSPCYYEINHEYLKYLSRLLYPDEWFTIVHSSCYLSRMSLGAQIHVRCYSGLSQLPHRRHTDNVDDGERLALSRNVRRKLSESGIPRGRPFYHSTKCLSIAVPFSNIARNRAWKYLHAHKYTRRSICDSYARIYQWRYAIDECAVAMLVVHECPRRIAILENIIVKTRDR